MAEHFDLMGDVVEDQQCFCHHKERFGQTEGVFSGRGQALETRGCFISEVTDSSAAKARQTLDRDYFVMRHFRRDRCERINRVTGAGEDNLIWFGADEAVTPEPFPAFDALQQERITAEIYFEEGGNRRLEVGVYLAIHRQQVALAF